MSLTHYTNGEDWFKDNWHGGVFKQIDLGYDDTEYEFWHHFKNSTQLQNYFLPLFNVPDKSMYIITSPATVLFGSIRVYIKNPNDTAEMAVFNKKLETFSDKLALFYDFAHTFSEARLLNASHNLQFDKRSTLNEKGVAVFNNPGITEEPYHKYFAEAINKFVASNGTGAYSNGYETGYNVYKILDDYYAVTHETMHCQDERIFMLNLGKRGGGEDFARGLFEQTFEDGSFIVNLSEDYKIGSQDITNNYSYKRIDTEDEFRDYYHKFFELKDYLDMILAKAFITLTPEQKAGVATQVSYPKIGNSKEEQELGDGTVCYKPLTLEDVKGMKLDSYEDLWDNHIMLKPGLKEELVTGGGTYLTDSVYNAHWYQSHADNDRADSTSFKWLCYVMGGIKGYRDGFVAYGSRDYIKQKKNDPNFKTTDLTALRYVTGDDSMTYKKYKLDTYNRLEALWNKPNEYVNAQKIYDEFRDALIKDSTDHRRNLDNVKAVKKKYFKGIKDKTSDFLVDPLTPGPEITINAQTQNIEIPTAESNNTNTETNQNEEDKTSNTDTTSN